MTYSDLNDELISRLPMLFEGYASLKAMWDGDEPGPHIVFEDVLVPFVEEMLRDDQENPLLRDAFAFLEELATNPDQEVRSVLGASVLERLASDPSIVAASRKHMGPSTAALMDEIMKS